MPTYNTKVSAEASKFCPISVIQLSLWSPYHLVVYKSAAYFPCLYWIVYNTWDQDMVTLDQTPSQATVLQSVRCGCLHWCRRLVVLELSTRCMWRHSVRVENWHREPPAHQPLAVNGKPVRECLCLGTGMYAHTDRWRTWKHNAFGRIWCESWWHIG